MTWKVPDKIFYTFALVVDFRTDHGHFPGFLETLCFCWRQVHELGHFFKNIFGRRIAFTTDQLVHGRAVNSAIFGHRCNFDVLGFDIFGKNLRKC